MSLSDPSFLTIGAIARHFGCATWQVRRLFERGLLPLAARVGQYRVVSTENLPAVQQALERAGYLAPQGAPA
jgi:hypothetical protein